MSIAILGAVGGVGGVGGDATGAAGGLGGTGIALFGTAGGGPAGVGCMLMTFLPIDDAVGSAAWKPCAKRRVGDCQPIGDKSFAYCPRLCASCSDVTN